MYILSKIICTPTPNRKKPQKSADELNMEGIDFYNVKKFQSAIECFNKALKQQPKDKTISENLKKSKIGLANKLAELTKQNLKTTDYSSAKKNAKKIVALFPEDERWQELNKLVDAYPYFDNAKNSFEKKDFTNAKTQLEKALEFSPNHIRFIIVKITILVDPDFNPIEEDDHSNIFANYQEATDLLSKLESDKKNQSELKQLITSNLNNLARTSLEEKKYKAAEAFFNKLLELSPENILEIEKNLEIVKNKPAEDLNNEGKKQLVKKKFTLAIKSFQDALELRPDHETYKKNLSLAINMQFRFFENAAKNCAKNNNFEKAFVFIKNAIEIEPQTEELKQKIKELQIGFYREKARFYNSKKEYEKAVKEIDTALKINPEDANLKKHKTRIQLNIYYLKISVLVKEKKQIQEALKNFYFIWNLIKDKKDFDNDREELATNLNNLGVKLLRQKSFELAAEYFSLSLKIKPKDKTFFKHLQIAKVEGPANELKNLGIQELNKKSNINYKKAQDFFTKALKLNPDDKKTQKLLITAQAKEHNHKGIEHSNNEEYDKAIKCYQEALKLEPENPVYKENIETTKKNKLIKTINLHLEEAIKHSKSERFEDAILEFKKILIIDPNNENALKNLETTIYNYAIIISKTEQKLKAIEVLEKYTNEYPNFKSIQKLLSDLKNK